MSTKDLSILSYKELQALAVKHRVPRNIKKLLLVKILHAIKCGNNSEVTKLLTDLKKNRKKRTKRIKTMNINENGTIQMTHHHNSPDHPAQQENYLYPVQQQNQDQYPFQWVGAEEEVGTSKHEMIKLNLDYNEIRQFMFLSAQSLNNSSLDEIVDLRTEPTITSNYQSSLETGQLDNARSWLLLKKMLQAPAGANLSEIASPETNRSSTDNFDSHSQQRCGVAQNSARDDVYNLFRPNHPRSPDTSETMSAKSDIDFDTWPENETKATTSLSRILENEQSCNINSYYRRVIDTPFYKSAIDNNGESNPLQCYEQQVSNQCQFNLAPIADAQENCRSWLASNILDISNPVDYEMSSTSRLESLPSVQYQSLNEADIINPSPGGSSNVIQPNQYCVNNDQLYTNQAAGLLEQNEIISDLQFDTTRFYQPPPSLDRSHESQDYYRQLCATADVPSLTQNIFYSQQHQQQHLSNEQNHANFSDYAQQLTTSIYHIDLDNPSFDPGYYQEQHQHTSVSTKPTESVTMRMAPEPDPLQQVQDQQFESYVAQPSLSTVPDNPPPTYGSSVLDAYWPRWSPSDKDNAVARIGSRSLENTLNLCTPNYVDYSKLNETNCVFSNKTPVMTLRKGLNSVPSATESRSNSVAPNNIENRQHSFASNWLLYNEDANNEANVKSRRSDSTASTSNADNQPDGFTPNWLLYDGDVSTDLKKRKLSTSPSADDII